MDIDRGQHRHRNKGVDTTATFRDLEAKAPIGCLHRGADSVDRNGDQACGMGNDFRDQKLQAKRNLLQRRNRNQKDEKGAGKKNDAAYRSSPQINYRAENQEWQMLRLAKCKIGAVGVASGASRLPFAPDDCSHLPLLKTPSPGESDICSRKRSLMKTERKPVVYSLKINFLKAISAIGFALSSFYGVSAQSTVFNIPSTDIQTARRLYVEADFLAHFSSFETGGYQLVGPRLVYGLNKRTEVGVNAFFVNTAPAEPIEIQPNFKFQLYKNEG